MDAPTRILYTIPNFVTAGSGRVMVNIAQRLDRKKFQPVICLGRSGGALEQEVRQMGIELFEAPFTVPVRPYITLLPRVFKAARVFKKRNCRIWHSFHYADDYTEPLIARFAGAKSWIYTKKAMGWGSRAWRIRSRLASRIVADNFDMPRVMFNTSGLAKKTTVIHHGVPTDHYAPSTETKFNLRGKFNCKPGSVLVGCVAHLVEVKGHPTLIEAMKGLDNAHLMLAGKPLDADYTAKLHAQVEKLGLADRVHFLGGIADVPGLLAELDIVVLPTWAKWRMEGCPVSLLEAMSCAKPCIATDIPGSRDIVQNEVNGILVPPEDPTSLLSALTCLAASPEFRSRMGSAARERILGQFTVEREASAHEKIYEGLC